MACQHLGDGKASFLSIAEALTEDTRHFLWSVEGSTVAGDSEVPAPLALPDSLQSVLHLGFGSTAIPSVLSFDMGLSELLLYAVAHVVGHALTFVDVLTERLGILAVAGLTGLIDLRQRAGDLVVRVLHTTFAHVGHVAVCARYAALTVDTHTPQLVVGVLSLEDGSARDLVRVVGVVHLVVVSLDLLDREALVVGEGEVLAIALEVILGVALSADERAHVLVGLLGDVFATTLEGFVEGGACGLELHGAGIVTVGAADGVHDLGSPLAPGSLVELSDTLLLHDAGHVGALTCPAGTRLDILVAVHTRGAGTKDLVHVFDSVLVSTRRVVLHREGVASP